MHGAKHKAAKQRAEIMFETSYWSNPHCFEKTAVRLTHSIGRCCDLYEKESCHRYLHTFGTKAHSTLMVSQMYHCQLKLEHCRSVSSLSAHACLKHQAECEKLVGTTASVVSSLVHVSRIMVHKVLEEKQEPKSVKQLLSLCKKGDCQGDIVRYLREQVHVNPCWHMQDPAACRLMSAASAFVPDFTPQPTPVPTPFPLAQGCVLGQYRRRSECTACPQGKYGFGMAGYQKEHDSQVYQKVGCRKCPPGKVQPLPGQAKCTAILRPTAQPTAAPNPTPRQTTQQPTPRQQLTFGNMSDQGFWEHPDIPTPLPTPAPYIPSNRSGLDTVAPTQYPTEHPTAHPTFTFAPSPKPTPRSVPGSCPVGYYGLEAGSNRTITGGILIHGHRCVQCPLNKYGAHFGAHFCKDCPAGKFTPLPRTARSLASCDDNSETILKFVTHAPSPWHVKPPWHWHTRAPTPVRLSKCKRGHYPFKKSCVACPYNKYQPTDHEWHCKICPKVFLRLKPVLFVFLAL